MKPLIGLIATTILFTSCENVQTGPMQHDSAHIDLDKSELTRVELKMGAGELHVAGGSAKLVDAEFAFNVPAWKPHVEYHSTGVRGDLVIEQPSGMGGMGNTEYRWDVKLNDGVLMDLVTHLGAGEAHMNLGSLSLRNVELHIGAGEVKMDLRGNPKRSYDVRINGGVGEATVYLPKGVGIDATAKGGIGDIHVEGLERRGERWVNTSQENSPVKIHLDVKGGVGQINLIAE
ncbi:MAG: toast rack family protein [Bryobacteraceae bacterium]